MISDQPLAVTTRETEYFRARVGRWGINNFEEFPWRHTNNPWHGLVAEIMLQRTKADQVEPVYRDFVSTYANPQEFVDNPRSNVFERLGLPERNTQFLVLNRFLVVEGIPHNKSDLLRLPGVGDYIASALLSLHLGIRSVLIDSNIVRVYGRYFGFNTYPETRRKRWFKELADAMTPARKHRVYNYAIIDFSRRICKPRPDHTLCPVKNKCRGFLEAGQSLG